MRATFASPDRGSTPRFPERAARGTAWAVKGQTAWTFLGRDTVSPYIDTRPLAQPNTPETREYMARGVIADAEVGVDSDIVVLVYGG